MIDGNDRESIDMHLKITAAGSLDLGAVRCIKSEILR